MLSSWFHCSVGFNSGLIWVREAKYPSSLAFQDICNGVILRQYLTDFMEVIKVAGPKDSYNTFPTTLRLVICIDVGW